MDPNFHLRHSVYYDFGAQLRTEFLFSHGLTAEVMQQHQFGPVLFREEAIFRKEIRFGDSLTMNLLVVSLTRDGARFAMRHEMRRQDALCATITVEGAWIDLQKRKLTAPPDLARQVLEQIPQAEDFRWHEK